MIGTKAQQIQNLLMHLNNTGKSCWGKKMHNCNNLYLLFWLLLLGTTQTKHTSKWIQGFSTLALIWIWDKQWMQWPNVVYFYLSLFFCIRLCVCICLTFALICIGVTACNMAQHRGEWLFATSKNFKGCWLLDALNIMWKTSLLRTLIVRTHKVLAVSKLSAFLFHYTTRCI